MGDSTGDAARRLRLIEVKGRLRGADTVTLSRNELLRALNVPDKWILALVEVPPVEELPADVLENLLRDDRALYVTAAGCQVRYVRRSFQREPDFDAVSVNYDWHRLWKSGTDPSVTSDLVPGNGNPGPDGYTTGGMIHGN